MTVSPSPSIDELLTEWEDTWLPAVKQQIYVMNHRRQVHDEFMELFQAQGHPDADVFGDCFHHMYVESQVLAIRRQVDDDRRTLSLRRLIGQLEVQRRIFTRTWYVDRWLGGRDPSIGDDHERGLAKLHLELANTAFDKFTDEPGGEQLGGRRLQQDREQLLQQTEKLVAFANAVVGHAQREALATEVTYDDFHGAIEHVGDMLQRYYLLINQGGLVTTTPIIQQDRKGPFRKPLL